MFRQAISRVRAISTLDISTAKIRTQQWEPALRLPSRPEPQDNNGAPENQNGPWFNTYTAFDPGCARPFLISGLSIGIKDLKPTVLILAPGTKTDVNSDIKEVKMAIDRKDKAAVQIKKPWPYRLPKALQPQIGTTFAAMYGRGLEASASSLTLGRVSILQAILYGVPEPDKPRVKKDRVLHKVLYGVKEDGEEK